MIEREPSSGVRNGYKINIQIGICVTFCRFSVDEPLSVRVHMLPMWFLFVSVVVLFVLSLSHFGQLCLH